jgi:hypothetical protein
VTTRPAGQLADQQAIAQIPASCICVWERPARTWQWIRTIPLSDCPWHTWIQPAPPRNQAPS